MEIQYKLRIQGSPSSMGDHRTSTLGDWYQPDRPVAQEAVEVNQVANTFADTFQ
jgi:hypothetical protein